MVYQKMDINRGIAEKKESWVKKQKVWVLQVNFKLNTNSVSQEVTKLGAMKQPLSGRIYKQQQELNKDKFLKHDRSSGWNNLRGMDATNDSTSKKLSRIIYHLKAKELNI